MKPSEIRKNFVYPEITAEHYVFGGGQLAGKIIREDGDWRPYLPPAEVQRRNGVESSACAVEAQQHSIATIMEEEYGIIDQNFSSRFNLIFSNATPQGSDPLKVIQTFRDKGLIPDTLLPFSDEIKSWEEFRSFKGGDRSLCEAQGRAWRNYWDVRYDIVFTKDEPLDQKYSKLRIALKSSPVSISVYGVTQGDTYAKKPVGANDTHLVEAIYVDERNRIYIFDTYAPFLKILPDAYNPDFAMRYTLEKRAEQVSSLKLILQQLIDALKQLLSLTQKAPLPIPEPVKDDVKRPDISTFALAIQAFEGWFPPSPQNPTGSVSYRNNNPGNIKGKDGKFLKFKSYTAGLDYLRDYIRRVGKGEHKAYPKNCDIRGFFKVYAPPIDGNEPNTYAAFVAIRCKVSPEFLIQDLVDN